MDRIQISTSAQQDFEQAVFGYDVSIKKTLLKTSPCVTESWIEKMLSAAQVRGLATSNFIKHDLACCFSNPGLSLSEKFITKWLYGIKTSHQIQNMMLLTIASIKNKKIEIKEAHLQTIWAKSNRGFASPRAC